MFVRGINCGSPDELRTEINRVMSDVFGGLSEWSDNGRGSFPTVNVWEDERAVFAEAELPGVQRENIEILVQGDEMTLKGERPQNVEGAMFHRRERGTGTFRRIVHLPTRVNADAVTATLQNGVLTVEMPKADDVLPRKIKVNV